jgi:hypothetical protein
LLIGFLQVRETKGPAWKRVLEFTKTNRHALPQVSDYLLFFRTRWYRAADLRVGRFLPLSLIVLEKLTAAGA